MNSMIARVLGEAGPLQHRIEPGQDMDPNSAGNWEVDQGMLQSALQQIKDRFIDERVRGFTNPKNGEIIPPVPREQAEARWEKAVGNYQKALANIDPTNPEDRQAAVDIGTHRLKRTPDREVLSYGKHQGD